jgi:hypothetical protein
MSATGFPGKFATADEPIECIFHRAGDAMSIFRRANDHGVCQGDLATQCLDDIWRIVSVPVGIEVRKILKVFVEDYNTFRRSQGCSGLKNRRI